VLQNFSLFHSIKPGSGAHATDYPLGTGDSFPGGIKRQKREADHLPPSSAKVKEWWSYTSIAPYIFMA
jgi:hypothetical protein